LIKKAFIANMAFASIQQEISRVNLQTIVESCRNIANDPSSGRLGKLINSLFSNSKLSHLVESPAANPGD